MLTFVRNVSLQKRKRNKGTDSVKQPIPLLHSFSHSNTNSLFPSLIVSLVYSLLKDLTGLAIAALRA